MPDKNMIREPSKTKLGKKIVENQNQALYWLYRAMDSIILQDKEQFDDSVKQAEFYFNKRS